MRNKLILVSNPCPEEEWMSAEAVTQVWHLAPQFLLQKNRMVLKWLIFWNRSYWTGPKLPIIMHDNTYQFPSACIFGCQGKCPDWVSCNVCTKEDRMPWERRDVGFLGLSTLVLIILLHCQSHSLWFFIGIKLIPHYPSFSFIYLTLQVHSLIYLILYVIGIPPICCLNQLILLLPWDYITIVWHLCGTE